MPLALLPDNSCLAVAEPSRRCEAETGLDRLIKLVPTEVLLGYPTLLGLSALISWPYYEPIVALLGLIAVVSSLHCDGRRTGITARWPQHVVRCLAFAAWTLVLGNPLAPLSVAVEVARLCGAVGVLFLPLVGWVLLPSSSCGEA